MRWPARAPGYARAARPVPGRDPGRHALRGSAIPRRLTRFKPNASHLTLPPLGKLRPIVPHLMWLPEHGKSRCHRRKPMSTSPGPSSRSALGEHSPCLSAGPPAPAAIDPGCLGRYRLRACQRGGAHQGQRCGRVAQAERDPEAGRTPSGAARRTSGSSRPWRSASGRSPPDRTGRQSANLSHGRRTSGSGRLLSCRPERNSDGAAHALALVSDLELSGELAGDRLTQQARAEARTGLRRERRSA